MKSKKGIAQCGNRHLPLQRLSEMELPQASLWLMIFIMGGVLFPNAIVGLSLIFPNNLRMVWTYSGGSIVTNLDDNIVPTT